MMVLYQKINRSATVANVESFMLVSGIAQSWLLAALLLPDQNSRKIIHTSDSTIELFVLSLKDTNTAFSHKFLSRPGI